MWTIPYSLAIALINVSASLMEASISLISAMAKEQEKNLLYLQRHNAPIFRVLIVNYLHIMAKHSRHQDSKTQR